MKINNHFLIIVLSIFLSAFSVQGQPLTSGAMDPTFGQQGKVQMITSGQFQLKDIALQSDGKIIVTGLGGKSGTNNLRGYFTVARYNSNGSLDTNFGNGGINFYTLTAAAEAKKIAIQNNGKIIVAGNDSSDFLIVRLNADGFLDTSFGIDGLLKIDFSDVANEYTKDIVNDIKIQGDNKILIAGYSTLLNSLFYTGYSITRISDDGLLDNTFGQNGKILDKNSKVKRSSIKAITIQSDGKIIGVGQTYISPDIGANSYLLSLRLNSNGTLDETFGLNGSNVQLINNATVANDVVVQQDGKIIVGGQDGRAFSTDEGFLIRYNTNGVLDSSFGDQGKVFLNFTGVSGGTDGINSIKLQFDGKILILGSFANPIEPIQGFGLARFLANGTLDSSFGNNGIVVTIFGLNGAGQGKALMLQPDGKILAGGIGNVDFSQKSSIVRYLWRRPKARGKY